MNVTVSYSDGAQSDLQQIHSYYAVRAGAEVAIRFSDRITATFERLVRRHPAAGRRRPDLGQEIRALPVVPYVVFYTADARRIRVVRILHGHRDIRPPLASLLLAC